MKGKIRTLAAAAAFSIAVTGIPAFAAGAPGRAFAAQDDQRHENNQRRDDDQRRDNDQRDTNRANRQDYSNNTYYRTGNEEGYEDYQKKQQRKSHDHKYRNDDDRTAHDYGYQQGWKGERGYKDNDDHKKSDDDRSRRSDDSSEHPH